MSQSPAVLLGSLFVIAAMVGCYKTEPIRSYPVAKEPKAADSAPAQQEVPPTTAAGTTGQEAPGAGAPSAATPGADVSSAPAAATGETDRMLAAIVPVGGQAWFFKLVGPVADVDKSAAEIEKFFNTIRIEGEQAKWDTPAQWKEDGPRGMRAATLWVPAGAKPLEMSVMPSGGSLLDNVNRWRGQMKLPPIDEAQLKETTREVKAGDQAITIVDLKGQFTGMGMMAPFAGGAGGAGAPGGGAPQLPPGHPPIESRGTDGNK